MKLFENLPSTKTPINAENLNQIQDNLVVVSATEPTGDNREKVWMQKGKNLFNKNNYNLYKGFIHGEKLFFVDNNYANTVYLRIEPNTTYTISRKIVDTDFAIGTGSFIPIANEQRINSYRDYKNEVSATITTGTEDKYIYIYLLWSDGATATLEEVLQGLQIEQGSTATEYEEYVEPKIYVKNDNNVYEEFISKEDTLEKYSTEEQRIGTWVDGKPIYRKVYRDLELTKGRGIILVYNVADIDKVISLKGMAFHNIYGGQWKPANYYFTDDDFLSILYDAAKNIVMDNTATEGTITITIEYTKTTD